MNVPDKIVGIALYASMVCFVVALVFPLFIPEYWYWGLNLFIVSGVIALAMVLMLFMGEDHE